MRKPITDDEPVDVVKAAMETAVSVAQHVFNPHMVGDPDAEPAMGVVVLAFPLPYTDGESRVLFGGAADFDDVLAVVEGFALMARKAKAEDGAAGHA